MSELAAPPLAGVPAADLPAIDYRSAFEQAPVGLVLSRHRAIIDCNQAVAAMRSRSIASARRDWVVEDTRRASDSAAATA